MKLSEKTLGRMRRDLLTITPELTAIWEDLAALGQTDRTEKGGVEVVRAFLDMLLVRQYDRVLRILAVLYETEPEALEDKTMEEITNMVLETLEDKVLWHFFPWLARWAHRT